jgi:hypothetical protein
MFSGIGCLVTNGMFMDVFFHTRWLAKLQTRQIFLLCCPISLNNGFRPSAKFWDTKIIITEIEINSIAIR